MGKGDEEDTLNFEIGKSYSNDGIYRSLRVGNAGGIRIQTSEDGSIRRAVLFTSVPSAKIAAENPYHDRLEGDVLVYTAAGRAGDQVLGGRNHRLLEQAESSFPIYCFQQTGSRRDASLGPKRWRFLGLLRYLRHWKERQADTERAIRTVWVFEFRLLHGTGKIAREFDREIMQGLIAEDAAKDQDYERDDDEGAIDASPPPAEAGIDPVETESLRRRMLCLDPEGFEMLVQSALVGSGFQSVEVTERSQDGGIDVNARAGDLMWPIRDLHVQVQAKRWIHTVGRREVAELRGSLQAEARGAIVTTSQFSHAAVREALAHGKRPITLIDGYDFARIVSRCGLPLV